MFTLHLIYNTELLKISLFKFANPNCNFRLPMKRRDTTMSSCTAARMSSSPCPTLSRCSRSTTSPSTAKRCRPVSASSTLTCPIKGDSTVHLGGIWKNVLLNLILQDSSSLGPDQEAWMVVWNAYQASKETRKTTKDWVSLVFKSHHWCFIIPFFREENFIPFNANLEFPNCRELLGRKIRLHWMLQDQHIYFRLKVHMDPSQFAAVGIAATG